MNNTMKDILIYSPDKYIVGEAYGLHRTIGEKPYKTETIIGILESYSETELTFITIKGKITVCTQNFDDDHKWYPQFKASNKDVYYTMYGMSIKEDIINSNFKVDSLYMIKDECLERVRTWYGIYRGHKPDSWEWLDLEFKNINTNFTEYISISDILRNKAFIYAIETFREIKLFKEV